MRKPGCSLLISVALAACGTRPLPPRDGGDAGADARDGSVNARDGAMEAGDVVDVAFEDAADATDVVVADVADAGMDAGPRTPSEQIAAVRAAAVGAVDIRVENVLVTYRVMATLRADGGVSPNDPAGFFVQADMTGPAVFVAVDPASLSPTPMVGDRVSFRATRVANQGMARWVTAVADFTRASSGNPVAPLVQDLSAAADLVSNLGDYESELIHLAGTVRSDFANAGTGFQSAQIETAGVPAMTNLRLRLPETLRATLGLRNGCTFTIDATPLWRFNAQAQPSAWTAADIMVGTCPALDAGMEGGAPDAGMDGAVEGGADAAISEAGTDAAMDTGGCVPRLVINEVAPRGPMGATDEFVELYNAGTCTVSLEGWQLRYSSASGSTPSVSWTGAATDSLPAGGYFLLTSMTTSYSALSNGRLTAGMAESGGVGLFSPAGTRIDGVAYGSAVTTHPFIEGTMPAPGTSSMTPSIARIPNGNDTNTNATDFQARATGTPRTLNR